MAFLIHYFLRRKKDISLKLFFEALKNENNGQLDAAVIVYESALQEITKNRFRSSSLKNKIIGKLKTLRAYIEYEKHLQR